MPLTLIVKSEVSKNIERYEGRIPHLYLDPVGKITVGVGHMVPNKSSMATVKMYKKGSGRSLALASLPEKQAEYDAIKRLPFGRRFGASGFYNTANGFPQSFDAMPHQVQMALFDMVFNLGLTKLRNQFIKFNSSLKANRWGDAAKHSNRMGIAPMRNKYVSDLLNSAQQVQP
jgi:GH24 family phage-related lysozyme (muramidase)